MVNIDGEADGDERGGVSFVRHATQAGAIMMDIVFSSTTQLAAAIRAGRVTAVEVLEAHLAQIEQHNPALNAIVTMDAERGL